MTQENRNYIKEVAKELALAMHQSRDKEISGLFADINKKLKVNDAQNEQMRATQLAIDEKLDVLDEKMNALNSKVEPIISEAEFWNQFWGRIRKGGNVLTWAVGVIAAALILTGQAKALLLAWLASKTF